MVARRPRPPSRSLTERKREGPDAGCMGGEGAGKGQTHQGRGMLSKEEADCIVVTKIERIQRVEYSRPRSRHRPTAAPKTLLLGYSPLTV